MPTKSEQAARVLARMAVPSEIRFVDLVHDTAEQVAQLCGVDEREAVDFALAVREAAVNAMTHGNGLDPARSVDLVFEDHGDRLQACVTDQGEGFDPAARPHPDAEENLMRSSGRGLAMMHHLVDHVSYIHEEGRGMVVSLVKRLHPAARPAGRR